METSYVRSFKSMYPRHLGHRRTKWFVLSYVQPLEILSVVLPVFRRSGISKLQIPALNAWWNRAGGSHGSVYDSKVQDASLVAQKQIDRAGELGLLTFSSARALALITPHCLGRN